MICKTNGDTSGLCLPAPAEPGRGTLGTPDTPGLSGGAPLPHSGCKVFFKKELAEGCCAKVFLQLNLQAKSSWKRS